MDGVTHEINADTDRLNISTHKAGKGSPRFKAIKYCIFLSGIAVFSQLYLFQPLLPAVGRKFGVVPAVGSFCVSASTIGMAVGLFIFAFKADSLSRKKLMTFAILSSSILTIASSFVNLFELLIVLNFLKGIVLSGVSAVALAYLAEEVTTSYVGIAISLYLAGNIFGGMCGRVATSLVFGWLGWQSSILIIGAATFVMGAIFARYFPESLFFVPHKNDISTKLRQMRRFLRDGMLIRLYLLIFLLMGCFVSIYNYIGFRLEAAPFSLPSYQIAFVFLMYIFGMFGTIVSGRMSEIYPPKRLMLIFTSLIIGGLLLLLSNQLFFVVLGLGIFTFNFFGSHTIASKLVSLHVAKGKSTAVSLYLLSYYVGSSIIGSSTGVVLHHSSWFLFILSLVALVIISLLFAIREIEIQAAHPHQ
jgi:YNFM family putative membrane transporter